MYVHKINFKKWWAEYAEKVVLLKSFDLFDVDIV